MSTKYSRGKAGREGELEMPDFTAHRVKHLALGVRDKGPPYSCSLLQHINVRIWLMSWSRL